MKNYFVYIIQCSDGTHYTGVTNNLDRRLIEHNDGIDKYAYTFQCRPVRLMWAQQFSTASDAIAFEKRVKDWSRKKKEALFKNDWKEVSLLSKKK